MWTTIRGWRLCLSSPVAVALIWVLLPACSSESESSFRLPRGATISIKTSETIATDTHKEGSTFAGEINAPIRDGLVTYVPLEAGAEGVVDFSGPMDTDPPTVRLDLRLTSVQLPNGETIGVETVPVVRESVPELQSDQVTLTTGLDVDLNRLLGGMPSTEGVGPAPGTPRVEIPRDSLLVFTLAKDVAFPAP